jgi:bifunctional DNase/RNase
MNKTQLIEAKVSDVIGPLPSGGRGLVVLSAGGKSFPVAGSYLETAMCHALLNGEEVPAYFFSVSVIKSAGKQLSEVVIFGIEEELGCRLIMGGKPPTKLPTDMVVSGINMALCGNVPIMVEKSVLERTRDSSSPYAVLKNAVPTLWPLSQLSQTSCLEALSNYLDAAGV